MENSDCLIVDDGSLTNLRVFAIIALLAVISAFAWHASGRPLDERVIAFILTMYIGFLLSFAVQTKSYCFDRIAETLFIKTFWLFGLKSISTLPLAELVSVTLRIEKNEDGKDLTQVVLISRDGEELQLCSMEYILGGTGHLEAATRLSEYLSIQLVRESRR